MYIQHQYNPAVVDNFLGDEFFRADRAATMKASTRTSVKEVQKLSQAAKVAIRQAGGPFNGRTTKRQKGKGQ